MTPRTGRVLVAALDELSHTFYKRIVEWYTFQLAAHRVGQQGGSARDKRVELRKADHARTAAHMLQRTIYETLRAEVGPGAAGYFLREQAVEPNRPQLAGVPGGALINGMWHRKDRLQTLILHLERAVPAAWPVVPPPVDPAAAYLAQWSLVVPRRPSRKRRR